MGKTKGTKHMTVKPPEIVGLEDGDKLVILADILLEIIFEEGASAAVNK